MISSDITGPAGCLPAALYYAAPPRSRNRRASAADRGRPDMFCPQQRVYETRGGATTSDIPSGLIQ
eukprot:131495-Prymnesium_polylepis.1